MIKFDDEKVLLLQQIIIKSTGGTAGVRDFKLLNSAIESAFHTFDGKDLYPTKQEKAARLGYALVSNHAFVDGNKRIGVLVMLSFLAINGIDIACTDEELIELGLGIACGEKKQEHVLAWIIKHKTNI